MDPRSILRMRIERAEGPWSDIRSESKMPGWPRESRAISLTCLAEKDSGYPRGFEQDSPSGSEEGITLFLVVLRRRKPQEATLEGEGVNTVS